MYLFVIACDLLRKLECEFARVVPDVTEFIQTAYCADGPSAFGMTYFSSFSHHWFAEFLNQLVHAFCFELFFDTCSSRIVLFARVCARFSTRIFVKLRVSRAFPNSCLLSVFLLLYNYVFTFFLIEC